MQCPFCNTLETRVVDSRLAEEGTQVRRRRECTECKGRFTTYERAQLSMPNIVKRGGDPEPFDEDKLLRGMKRALFKLPVSPDALDHAIENIKRKLRQSGEREVPSPQLGEWVMDELRDLDHIAYVRFASIYRKFEDVNAFREEIERLQQLPTAEQRKSQLSLIGGMEADASGSPKLPQEPRNKKRGK